MTLSDYLMRLTTRFAPKGRQEWAQAMQAEFDVLTRGKLSWALGCLITASGWRLRSEALYLLAIPLGVIIAEYGLLRLIFFSIPPVFESETFLWGWGFYLWVSLPLIFISICLGAWRPNRIIQTGVFVALTEIVQNYVYFFFFFHMPFGNYIHIFNRPPLIGEAVVLTGCLISTAIGSLIATSLGRWTPTSRVQGL